MVQILILKGLADAPSYLQGVFHTSPKNLTTLGSRKELAQL